MTNEAKALAAEAMWRYPQLGGSHRQAFIDGANWAKAQPAVTTEAEPVAWQPLPYSTPQELAAAFKQGARFVLHYHGKTFDVTHMSPREHIVYVQPPSLAVKVRPDGSSAEGTSGGIWLAALPAANTAGDVRKCPKCGRDPALPESCNNVECPYVYS